MWIDVATGHDDADTLASPLVAFLHKSCTSGSTRAFGDLMRGAEKKAHRFGDFIIGDDHDVISTGADFCNGGRIGHTHGDTVSKRTRTF